MGSLTWARQEHKEGPPCRTLDLATRRPRPSKAQGMLGPHGRTDATISRFQPRRAVRDRARSDGRDARLRVWHWSRRPHKKGRNIRCKRGIFPSKVSPGMEEEWETGGGDWWENYLRGIIVYSTGFRARALESEGPRSAHGLAPVCPSCFLGKMGPRVPPLNTWVCSKHSVNQKLLLLLSSSQ